MGSDLCLVLTNQIQDVANNLQQVFNVVQRIAVYIDRAMTEVRHCRTITIRSGISNSKTLNVGE